MKIKNRLFLSPSGFKVINNSRLPFHSFQNTSSSKQINKYMEHNEKAIAFKTYIDKMITVFLQSTYSQARFSSWFLSSYFHSYWKISHFESNILIKYLPLNTCIQPHKVSVKEEQLLLHQDTIINYLPL